MKYSISSQGVAIRFANKPEAEILSMLKANGFRWNPASETWYRRRVTGAADFLGALDRKLNPNRPDGPCWTCGKPGRWRDYATTSQIYCNDCAAAHRRLWERDGR